MNMNMLTEIEKAFVNNMNMNMSMHMNTKYEYEYVLKF